MLPLFIATNIYLKINIVYCTFFILFFFVCVCLALFGHERCYTQIKLLLKSSLFILNFMFLQQCEINCKSVE